MALETRSAPVELLGTFPFSLNGEQLRARAREEYASAEQALERLLRRPGPRTEQEFLDPLNRLLCRVYNAGAHGYVMFNVHPDPDVRRAGRETSESSDRFFSAFLSNPEAYRALGDIDLTTADPATRFAVSKMLRDMRRAGVELEPDRRTHVRELADEITAVSHQYAEGIANSIRFIKVTDPAQLEGLPADYLASHPPGADGTVRISIDYPDWLPVHTYCKSSEVRRRIFQEAMNRGFPENVAVIERLLRRRAEFAHELGYPNFAIYALEDKMLTTPQAVRDLLDRSAALLRPLADAEFSRQLERKRRDEPGAARLGPWDLRFMSPGYYEDKIALEEIGGTTGELREFLPYGPVRDGLFRLCEGLFGLTIRPVPDAAVWHSSVDAYDVHRGDRFVGRFYLDMTPREGKFTHDGTAPVRVGVEGVVSPQAVLMCNFLDPGVPKESARVLHADVVTFFHEFGHLLHALLSGHGRWLYNSWLHIERDFIEVASQLFEEWAFDPEVLQRFARNPDTQKRPSSELLNRVRSADRFGRSGYWLLALGASLAALELHERDPTRMDISTTLKEAAAHYSPIPEEPEYHRETGWSHLTGYSACYYTYLWSMILARDILQVFQKRGSLTDSETSKRYMDLILTPGASRPAAEMFRSFMGRDFSYEPFERWVQGA